MHRQATSVNNVPKGWRLARLGDVSSLRTEQVKPGGCDSKPYVALEHIVSGGSLTGYGKASDSVSYKTTFCKGDTLYGKLRPNLRKVVRAEFDGVCSTEILAVRARDSADAHFLSHLLKSEQLHGYAMQGITGTKMPRTSWRHLRGFEILLPPLAEQRAIAAVLDSIDDAIEQTEAVSAATEQLRDSLRHQLLTRGVPGWHTEWREAPGLGTIPADWEVVRLGEVLKLEYGVSLPERERRPGQVPVIGSAGSVGFHDCPSVNGPGVVVGRKGSIGSVTWVAEDFIPIDTTYFAVPLDGLLDLRWVYYLLSREGLSKFNRATGVPGLNRDDVYALVKQIPPLAEQRAIAAVLDGVDEAIEHSRRETYMLKCLKESTADALLTGRVRVSSLTGQVSARQESGR